MASNGKDTVLVVLQLSGGNDYMNTVVPYTDPNYYDNRQTLNVPEDDVIKLDGELGLNPTMGRMAEMYGNGDLAIVHGVGWEGSNRSHFRCMDIWHTAEPDKVGTEGWLGQAVRQMDPDAENPVMAVNVGQGLPRAMVADGVSVASVGDISSYGMLTDVEQEELRQQMLQRFARMYAPAIGSGPVMDYLGQTGLDALKGADMIKLAPQRYSSDVEYAASPLASKLRDIAMIHTAGLGSRVFYTDHAGYDTHATQATTHPKLWTQVNDALADFWDDLREHDADDNVVLFVFSEFGRRVKENGTGTDHGSAGVCFAMGPRVKGGMYGVYPERRAEALKDGDLDPNLDFRGVESALMEDWLGVDATPVVNGRFEKPGFVMSNE